MEAWIYLIGNTPRVDDALWDSDGILFAAIGFHFVVGFLIGRLSALWLPLAACLLAIPAGYAYGQHAGEYDFFPVIPIWAGLLLASLIFIPVMLGGILLGAWIRFRTMTRGRRASGAHGAS
jgi:hypothetical protein